MNIRYGAWRFIEKIRTQQMINVARWMLKRLDDNQCREAVKFAVYPSKTVECDVILEKLSLRLFGWTQGDLEHASAKIKGPQPDAETGLVPCGCGGSASFHVSYDDKNWSTTVKIACNKCLINVAFSALYELRGVEALSGDAKNAWNAAMGYTEPPRPGAIGPETGETAPNGEGASE